MAQRYTYLKNNKLKKSYGFVFFLIGITVLKGENVF